MAQDLSARPQLHLEVAITELCGHAEPERDGHVVVEKVGHSLPELDIGR